MCILPQITQITQRNAAGCIISQRKTVSLRLRLFCCFVVCLRKSARSAGDTGVSFEQYRLSKFGCIFSRRQRRSRRGMQQAALYRRERQIVVNVVLLFVVRLRKSARSAGDFWGFICVD